MHVMYVASTAVRRCAAVVGIMLSMIGLLVPVHADEDPVLVREAVFRGERVRVFQDAAGKQWSERSEIPTASRMASPGPAAWALGAAWTLRVDRSGLQRVSGVTLAGVGAPTTFSRLCLRTRGQPVPMHLWDADGDGRVEATDEIVFYVASVGSRYDEAEVFWLTDEPACHVGMPVRSANSTGPVVRTAVQRGERRLPARHSAAQAGPDGDHWFDAWLVSDAPWIVTPTIAGALPPIAGTTIVTINGAARFVGAHRVALSSGGSGETRSLAWSGHGVFTRAVTLNDDWTTLTMSVDDDSILVDALYWERPVALEYAGAGGVFAASVGGAHVVSGTWVYDVSDSAAPTAIRTSGGVVDAAAGRSYLIVGSDVSVPVAPERYAPRADVTTPRNAEAVYIAPAAWIGALEPLLQHRRAVGVTAIAVPVEALYEQFGDGRRSPYAVRDFLRYAFASWSVRPVGVVLVGDASFDVRNYSYRTETYLPTFLLDVDLGLTEEGSEWSEGACDACFAQLDGDDPLSDLAPDLIFGRIPAQSAAQVSDYVRKVLSYEAPATGAGENQWRSTVLYLVDDTIRPDGGVDPAGDFWRSADESIAAQNLMARVARLYYDPTGALGARSFTVGKPDVDRNISPPYLRTRALIERGAALVNYIGHASVNRIGNLDYESVWDNYLLHQDDAESLRTAGKLPILVQMTCKTSDFTSVDQYWDGETLVEHARSFDERMVLAREGAIAAWGSTGYGIAHGHDDLLRGFYDVLWGPGGRAMTLGALAEAGYLRVLERGDDVGVQLFRTYDVIGDPFLRPQVWTPGVLMPADSLRVYAPMVGR